MRSNRALLYGGAVCSQLGPELIVDHGTFYDNEALKGGACFVHVTNSTSLSFVRIRDALFRNNTAYASGGAVALQHFSDSFSQVWFPSPSPLSLSLFVPPSLCPSLFLSLPLSVTPSLCPSLSLCPSSSRLSLTHALTHTRCLFPNFFMQQLLSKYCGLTATGSAEASLGSICRHGADSCLCGLRFYW